MVVLTPTQITEGNVNGAFALDKPNACSTEYLGGLGTFWKNPAVYSAAPPTVLFSSLGSDFSVTFDRAGRQSAGFVGWRPAQ